MNNPKDLCISHSLGKNHYSPILQMQETEACQPREAQACGLCVRQSWIQTPALPLVNGLTLGKGSHISDNSEHVYLRESKKSFL